jgi:serine/threonine protein phosphatase PrpC
MTTIDARCPACDAPLQSGDRFCEQCGTRLDEPGEDRVELDLVTAAAVSDRGRVHRRNEDSFYLKVGQGRGGAVVVCDGISSSSAGNVAARDAAAAAGAVLEDAVADPSRDAGEVMTRAIEAAGGAVERVPWTTRTGRVDPSCTLVSALCRRDEIVVGWLGDSRAYWLDGDGLRQLTVDDSLAEEGVARGMLTPDQAARSPVLHSITHWVGPDAPERPPRLVVLRPERPGRLILCTDGLWNYMPSVDELADLIAALPAGATPAAVARSLTDTALTRGGRDNITVAVLDVDPSS